MKIATFDIEIAKDIPEGADWQTVAPLGISCAAVAFSDGRDLVTWSGAPQMTSVQCQELVATLQKVVSVGYMLLTWNGCAFDFAVLANESGRYAECAELAMNHVDMMLMVTFTKGYYLSLEKALKGAHLEGKVKQITLTNGTILSDMGGKKAPQLWSAGEYKAVLTYLSGDVTQLLGLAEWVQKNRVIQWTSNSGRPQSMPVAKLLTVQECFELPLPDTSWMTNPGGLSTFV